MLHLFEKYHETRFTLLSTKVLRRPSFSECAPVFFLTNKNVCSHAPSSKRQITVRMSPQNCASSIWSLLHVSLQVRKICKWLLTFWKNLWIPDPGITLLLQVAMTHTAPSLTKSVTNFINF